MDSKECTKCIHEVVCESAKSCDGRVPGCEHFKEGWISVKDRLPKEHRLVLCRWTRGIGASYGLARYNHDNDVWYVSNEGMPEVTHWMPLPEAPKGE